MRQAGGLLTQDAPGERDRRSSSTYLTCFGNTKASATHALVKLCPPWAGLDARWLARFQLSAGFVPAGTGTGTGRHTGIGARWIWMSVAQRSHLLGSFRDLILDIHAHPFAASVDGREWPPPGSAAVSMAGQRRLDQFAAAIMVGTTDLAARGGLCPSLWVEQDDFNDAYYGILIRNHNEL